MAAAKSLLDLSKSTRLRTAAANNPDLKQGLAQIVTTTAEMLKELQSNLTAPQEQTANLNDRTATLLGE